MISQYSSLSQPCLFLSPYLSHLLASHQSTLLFGNLALTLPAVSETREQVSENQARRSWENHHVTPLPPPNSLSLFPYPSNSQRHRTPANWFHLRPCWARIKVCKGMTSSLTHTHTHILYTQGPDSISVISRAVNL